MLKIKGWLRAAALCAAFCLLLTGCSLPMQEETVQVEELLRAPRLAGDYGALQTALNDWLGGERPAEISAAGRPAVALCAAGFRRRRRTGRSGVLHHGPQDRKSVV